MSRLSGLRCEFGHFSPSRARALGAGACNEGEATGAFGGQCTSLRWGIVAPAPVAYRARLLIEHAVVGGAGAPSRPHAGVAAEFGVEPDLFNVLLSDIDLAPIEDAMGWSMDRQGIRTLFDRVTGRLKQFELSGPRRERVSLDTYSDELAARDAEFRQEARYGKWSDPGPPSQGLRCNDFRVS